MKLCHDLAVANEAADNGSHVIAGGGTFPGVPPMKFNQDTDLLSTVVFGHYRFKKMKY